MKFMIYQVSKSRNCYQIELKHKNRPLKTLQEGINNKAHIKEGTDV